MAIQSLALPWRTLATGQQAKTFYPGTAWYRLNDLAALSARTEGSEVSPGVKVVPAVEIDRRTARQLVTIGRPLATAGAGRWHRRALSRRRPFLLRAGWVAIGPPGSSARVRGEVELRHSGASSRAVLELVGDSIGKDGQPDEAVVREALDVVFPRVPDRTHRDIGLGTTACAVESCSPHNCTANYTVGDDPSCPTEGSCGNDDCTIVICRDGYECSGGNTCQFLGCDGQYSYEPPCTSGYSGGPGCVIDWGGAGGECWVDLTPPSCEGLHVTRCEGLNEPCQGIHVNCGDVIVSAPCGDSAYVTSPDRQRAGASWVLIGQLLRRRRQEG